MESEVVMGVVAIHPGEHLAKELEALDMSAAELARKIDVPTNRMTEIMNAAAIPRCGLRISLGRARSFGSIYRVSTIFASLSKRRESPVSRFLS
jgi:hypothetical protein